MANFLSRIIRPFLKTVEGDARPGPWYLPISGGYLPADSPWNWWQLGQDIESFSPSAMVEACVSAYSQTVAMCPGDHWRGTDDGGRKKIATSSLSRVLRQPNAYQSISDFLLNLVRGLYTSGNAYALALRNNRNEIVELHLMNPRSCGAIVAPETGDIFYNLGGNTVISRQLLEEHIMVPARDVLHVRLHTTRNTLLGETPLVAAAADIAANNATMQQQINFYLNQARPSFVLQTEMTLDKDQVAALRQRWDEQAKGLNAGGTPILTSGLKAVPLSASAKDSELAEIMRLTEQHIALVFRIPLQILGIGGGAITSTETLMQSWIASGLGFCLNHVETAFDRLFELSGVPDEYVEFDTRALLRSDQKQRIDSLARGVQGGIYSPNEARREEGLPEVKYGDEPRVQQQVVPLSAAAAIPASPAPGAAPTAPPSSGIAGNALVPAKDFMNEPRSKTLAREWLSSADRHDRRRSA